MLKRFKLVFAGALLALAGFLLTSTFMGNPLPKLTDMVNTEQVLRPFTFNVNASTAITDAEQLVHQRGAAAVRRQVRNAAVEVVTPMGRGSGTLFEIDGHYVVFTAAHVIRDFPVVAIEGRNGETVFGTAILHATDVDMAIVLVPEMNSRTPMKYNPAKRRDINDIVGTDVTYTGFPSHHDLLTIDGTIASEEGGNLVMHSYAWPGSSGAGIFDMQGRFIGVVRAVDVGVWSYQLPPQLVEDMVWIAPSWGITHKELKRHLRERGSE